MRSFLYNELLTRYRQLREKHLAKAVDFWHRGSAWILGSLLVGVAAVLFAYGSDYAGHFHQALFQKFPLLQLIIMPAGFALIAYLSARFFPGTQGSGIPQTIAALDEADPTKKNTLLSLRIIFGKIGLTLGGLSVGASIGREGPTVQIGAAIMHLFYGRGPFRTAEQRRTLIIAGGAAGIASAFNTPLAGIMFAIEELSKKHLFTANSWTLITVIFSGLISLAVLGNYSYFGTTGAYANWQSGTLAALVCGVLGGAAGGFFSRAIIKTMSELPLRLATFIADYPFRFAAACGIVIALLGLLTDGMVFGTGYDVTRQTLEDRSTLPWYFGISKLIATFLSSVCGIPGGLFAPSLSVGAGLGDNIAAIFPTIAPHSAIILLTMVAYLAGVTRAPITSFIIMMEMTDSHQLLLPLMAASVVASSTSRLICPQALYPALAEKMAAK